MPLTVSGWARRWMATNWVWVWVVGEVVGVGERLMRGV